LSTIPPKTGNNEHYNLNPVYLSEIIRTFGAGIFSTAAANHLLIELRYDTWIVSVVSALYFLGFLIFTLLFGHISDKFGQKKVMVVGWLVSAVFGGLSLIPITNTFRLILFSIWRFIDGGSTGIFWPTAQKYTIVAEREGLKRKNEFLSKYNFSWNLGFLFSMIGGTLLVYEFKSNYLIFYISFILMILGSLVSIFWLKPVQNQGIMNENLELGDKKSENNEVETDQIEYSGSTIKPGLDGLQFKYIILILLTHSLTDGAVIIALPLKIVAIGLESYWVFLLNLCKLIAQIFSTTKFSNTKSHSILPFLYITSLSLFIIWLLFSFTLSIWILLILVFLSGLAQGTTYALGMKLMSLKAEKMQSARPYSIFQATMGSGRMVGQLNIGMWSMLSQNAGLWVLSAYDLFAFTYFLVNTKGKYPSKPDRKK
jgi:MFS family permease